MPSTPNVERLEPLARRSSMIRVHLTRGDPLEIPLVTWLQSGLHVGDPIPSNRMRELEKAGRHWRIRETALAKLARRPHSRSEVARHLLKKGHPAGEVDAVLDELEERGFLDDAAFAESFVRDRIRHRPKGTRALVQELRRKGVGSETASRAVEVGLEAEETDEFTVATRAGSQWARTQGRATLEALTAGSFSEERQKARRRLYGYLARRGFGGPALSAAMDAALREAGHRLGGS
jgi:regulatory protein